jgi:predicted PurR-regulated permease PerM
LPLLFGAGFAVSPRLIASAPPSTALFPARRKYHYTLGASTAGGRQNAQKAPGMAKDRGSSPLFMLVAVVTAIAALYFAKAILLPISLAILLSFLLAPLADRLERWHVPRVPAVLIVVALAFSVIVGIGWVVTKQVYDLTVQLPNHRTNILRKIEAVRPKSPVFTRVSQTLAEFRDAITGERPDDEKESTEAQSEASPASEKLQNKSQPAETQIEESTAGQADETVVRTKVEPESTGKEVEVQVVEKNSSVATRVQGWLGSLVEPLTTIGMVIILVLFLLLDRENQRARLVQLFGRTHLHAATEAIHDMTTRVSRYLRMLFLVNSSYGAAIAIGLWFLGVPGAIMWGVLAFSLRFIPYLGPWIAASIPILVSIATSESWTQPLLVVGWFIAIELVSNNLIEPLVYGSTVGISTVGVVLSAIFWTWLWGPIGLILAMPMTVCLVVVSRYVPQLRFITVMLADQPPLTQGERVYQRLLAFDYHEPLKMANKIVADSSLAAYYDDVLVPALIMAEHDRHADLLNDDQMTFVEEAAEDLVAELGESAVAARLLNDDTVEEKPQSGDASAENAIRSTRVLCVPLRDTADEVASQMLAQLLIAEGFAVVTAGAELLAAEVVQRVAATDADIVVISILPPIAPRDSRLLWKRLRLHYPDLPIVVGMWNGGVEKDVPIKAADDDNASRTVTSLAEAVALVRSLAAQQKLTAKAV